MQYKYPPMANLEQLIAQDRLRGDAFEARMQAQSNREAGWTSLFIATPLALAGGFTAKCTMELAGTTGNWLDIKQDAIIAVSGLAWAAAGMIGAKRHMDVSPMNFVRSWKQKRTADNIGAQIAQSELAVQKQEDNTY
ncbi:MAG: hypothetical protein Q7R60_01865 [bacterium]|nr:hypothetical protein [bacterium]